MEKEMKNEGFIAGLKIGIRIRIQGKYYTKLSVDGDTATVLVEVREKK